MAVAQPTDVKAGVGVQMGPELVYTSMAMFVNDPAVVLMVIDPEAGMVTSNQTSPPVNVPHEGAGTVNPTGAEVAFSVVAPVGEQAAATGSTIAPQA